MDVTDALDREEIVERAEAVRFWLLGFELSSRATGAIQRELGAIIANGPGDSDGGRRPLAGLTVADFIAELHSPNGGSIGRVKSVGEMALRELRAQIPAPSVREAHAPPAAAPEPAAEAPTLEPEPPEAPTLEPEPPEAPAQPAPRRRGRPKGSTRPARNGTAPVTAAQAPAPTASSAPTSGTHDDRDPQIDQLLKLWPSLHPHARRAVALFASDMLIEAAHEHHGPHPRS